MCVCVYIYIYDICFANSKENRFGTSSKKCANKIQWFCIEEKKNIRVNTWNIQLKMCIKYIWKLDLTSNGCYLIKTTCYTQSEQLIRSAILRSSMRCRSYMDACVHVYVKYLMLGQINGKFNNVTTMTANNNQVVAISNIVINISIKAESKMRTKVQTFANARRIVQPSLARALSTPSLPPKLFIIH